MDLTHTVYINDVYSDVYSRVWTEVSLLPDPSSTSTGVPVSLRHKDSLATCKSKLKPHLFRRKTSVWPCSDPEHVSHVCIYFVYDRVYAVVVVVCVLYASEGTWMLVIESVYYLHEALWGNRLKHGVSILIIKTKYCFVVLKGGTSWRRVKSRGYVSNNKQ